MSLDKEHYRMLLRERQMELVDSLHESLTEARQERETAALQDVMDTKDTAFREAVGHIRRVGLEREAEELEDIRAALARLEQGTYGICIACEEPVPEPRLQAWPTAKRCRPCQQEYEQSKTRKA